jgi:hypothetical protein
MRWELVQRVIESPHLVGSARLRDFLLHVTACAIRETPEDATEQQIGIRVFQRSPGFNSSEDSIVRSKARLLRLKLSAYFNAEGAAEPLIIEIPKGHYFPVFFHPNGLSSPEKYLARTRLKRRSCQFVSKKPTMCCFLGRPECPGRKDRGVGWQWLE